MSLRDKMNSTGKYLRELVNLSEHIDVLAAMTNIRSSVPFRGPNVFILFFAILIASLGLNVNSIPVIIGAMLVSPLMGPIIGFGLGLGTNDTDLVWEALKNLVVMVVISILASTLYFVLTPLDLEQPTELLARTKPTIYDVLIALFGGLAGIVETSRKEKGTVMSGVAIATALMPPLCTVGYGIAQLNWQYALGAMYLFFINSVFISLATFIMVKYFRYPSVQLEDQKKQSRRQWVVYVILVIVLIPGVFSTIDIVQDNNTRRAASRLISSNKSIGKSYIFDYKIDSSGKQDVIDLYIAGERLSDESRERFYQEAEKQGFMRSQIVFHEDAVTEGFDQEALVKDLFEYHSKQLSQKDAVIDSLRKELRMREDELEELKQAKTDSL
ncbi:MAG: DUF389 domain-containing protein [Paludibacteraceae bacterium]|nr:DUF389 domain-containing protein [Paludibacteraceae bacterium]